MKQRQALHARHPKPEVNQLGNRCGRQCSRQPPEQCQWEVGGTRTRSLGCKLGLDNDSAMLLHFVLVVSNHVQRLLKITVRHQIITETCRYVHVLNFVT